MDPALGVRHLLHAVWLLDARGGLGAGKKLPFRADEKLGRRSAGRAGVVALGLWILQRVWRFHRREGVHVNERREPIYCLAAVLLLRHNHRHNNLRR